MKTATQSSPDYCSLATVARRLDCGETTVRDYVDRNLLPKPRRFGGLVRWKWSEIEDRLDGLARGNGNEGEADPILRAINGR